MGQFDDLEFQQVTDNQNVVYSKDHQEEFLTILEALPSFQGSSWDKQYIQYQKQGFSDSG